ncbi:MAG: response regulator [Acidobacteria bacterium]|nr:MAG: response regulator [Acidobacteriota bacterium]
MARRSLILCLDDERNALEGRKQLLEGHGCEVLVTTSPQEALRLFVTNPVDLVLLDFHMPEMNGDVVARRMKASKGDVPIAMLSADEELSETLLQAVDAFISKSEPPRHLLKVIEQLLNLRTLFAPLDDSEPGEQTKRIA